jgi:hypothetical protein
MVHPRWFLVVTCLVTAAPALAGGKVKAHIECESVHPIESSKPIRLADHLDCSIAVEKEGGYKDEEIIASLKIIPPKQSALLPIEHGGPLGPSPLGAAFVPDPWKVDSDYKLCEPFVVEGTLSVDTKPVWSQRFAVAASCAKPKRVTGAIACHYTAQDGTQLKWPGNGVKLKPRLEQTFYCSITATKLESDVTYEATLGIAGAKPTTASFTEDAKHTHVIEAQFEEETYHACGDFSVAGEIRAGGASLWTGKLAVKQFCPD